jgi:hypothetical protein
VDHNIHGNGHMMMVEKNNRDVLKPILAWVEKNVNAAAKAPPSRTVQKKESTSLRLADMGYFWVGAEEKRMPYGTILSGQMYVQYFTPAEVRHPYPVVLVHGGGGSMLHYMGVGEQSGWAHHYVQEGYRVYLVDRPGHGRAPYHPDALGPIGNNVTYAAIAADTRRAAIGPNRQWPGTGDVGDPLLDQMLAGQMRRHRTTCSRTSSGPAAARPCSTRSVRPSCRSTRRVGPSRGSWRTSARRS